MHFVIKPNSDGRWGIRLDGLGCRADAIDLKVGYDQLIHAENHVLGVTQEIRISVERDVEQLRETRRQQREEKGK